MITENLSTLKIHKLSQAQYDRELEAGNIDKTALYLTPESSTMGVVLYEDSTGVSAENTIEFDTTQHSLFAVTVKQEITECVIFCGKHSSSGYGDYISGSNVTNAMDVTDGIIKPMYFRVVIWIGGDDCAVDVAAYSRTAEFDASNIGGTDITITKIVGII